MRTNAAGRALIVEFEGFHTEAYPDPASPLAAQLRLPPEKRAKNWKQLSGEPWTIGVGATGPGIGPGLIWTKGEAMIRFEKDIRHVEHLVHIAVSVPLTENQFSAVVSFTFNLGIGNLRRSTLLRKLNEGNYHDAAAEFPRWIYARGKVLPGLRRRRLAEQALFLRSPESDDLA